MTEQPNDNKRTWAEEADTKRNYSIYHFLLPVQLYSSMSDAYDRFKCTNWMRSFFLN